MLEVSGIETFYGSAQALHGVSLQLKAGELVALMGRNGMGKTTTIRSIFSLTPPRRGTVKLDGENLSGLPPHRVARRGLGLVPEGRRIFPNLTVAENLIATARKGPGWSEDRVYGLFPRLAERRGQIGATLSGGEQQMLAIGRALLTNPRILVLDEATEGLAPTVRRDIWQAIRVLREDKLAILIVDKTLKELLPIADRCVIVEKGRSVWTGSADHLAKDKHVQDRYLGV